MFQDLTVFPKSSLEATRAEAATDGFVVRRDDQVLEFKHHKFMENQMHYKKSTQQHQGKARTSHRVRSFPSPNYLAQNLFF